MIPRKLVGEQSGLLWDGPARDAGRGRPLGGSFSAGRIGASTTGIGFPTPFCLANAPGPLPVDRCYIVRGLLPPSASPQASGCPPASPGRYGDRGVASQPTRLYGASWRRPPRNCQQERGSTVLPIDEPSALTGLRTP